MKIIFVRHGKDDDRYRGGWSNRDLVSEGLEQSKKLARYLKANTQKYDISIIVSSDLQRAMTTANVVSIELGVPVRKDSKLREINNGDLAGMSNEEALVRYPGLFFSSMGMDEAYPNGESPKEFYLRVKTWFKKFVLQHRKLDSDILVVTHGGVINIVYHLVNNIAWTNQSCLVRADNCSLYVLDVDAMDFEIENPVDFGDRLMKRSYRQDDNRLTKHSYMWEEDKDKYALLIDEVGCSIFNINGKELMFVVIEEEDLHDLIVQKMMNSGTECYRNFAELQEAVNKQN